MAEQITPNEMAEQLDITPHTLRRWCAYHGAYLSPGANPPTGQARRFTGRDLEVLKQAKLLREGGLTVAAINKQLGTLTFTEIDTEEDIEETTEAQPDNSLAVKNDVALMLTVQAIQAHDRRLDAMETSLKEVQQTEHKLLRDFIFAFMAGAVIMLILVLILIVAVDLWAK